MSLVHGYQSLQELLEQDIRQDILSGTLPAGTRLVEAEMTGQYGVSRGPIREVLRALEAQGLVTRERGKGARVAAISIVEMRSIHETRMLLEERAAQQAVENVGETDLARAAQAWDRLKSTPVTAPQWLETNFDFHCAVYELSRNQVLVELIRSLMIRGQPFVELYLSDMEHRKQSAAEHEGIWRALLDGDVERFKTLTRQHLSGTAGQLEQMLKDSPSPDPEDPGGCIP